MQLLQLLYTALLVILWPFVALYLTYLYLACGKYRGILVYRLGLARSHFGKDFERECIWIHAVSLGETNAVAPLIEKILAEKKKRRVVLSHLTKAGFDHGKRLFGDKIEHMILPFDLPWLIYPLVKELNPSKLIFVEADWWPNLVLAAKHYGADLYLVNGRISPRSFGYYKFFKPVLKPFFSRFTTLATQSDSYSHLLLELGARKEGVKTAGNLKLSRSLKINPDRAQKWKAHFPENSRIVILTCSHAGEELLLIRLSEKLPEDICYMVAPRHSERFDEVEKLLKEHEKEVARWTRASCPSKWLLIDSMGLLDEAYQVADVALVGGTWVSHVGGHNILEPVMAGVPTLYGPYIYKQPDFDQLAKQTKLAECVEESDLAAAVKKHLDDPQLRENWNKRFLPFQKKSQGSVDKVFEVLGL